MVRSLKCDKVCLTFAGILILILFVYATVIFSTRPTVEQKLIKNIRHFFNAGIYTHLWNLLQQKIKSSPWRV